MLAGEGTGRTTSIILPLTQLLRCIWIPRVQVFAAHSFRRKTKTHLALPCDSVFWHRMDTFVTLTAKIIGPPADGDTFFRTSQSISCNHITETSTVAHWWTRACCFNAHFYIWLRVNLRTRGDHKVMINVGLQLLFHVAWFSIIRLTWMLHFLKMGPVSTRQDCSTVTNLIMFSLQGAAIWMHKQVCSVNVCEMQVVQLKTQTLPMLKHMRENIIYNRNIGYVNITLQWHLSKRLQFSNVLCIIFESR